MHLSFPHHIHCLVSLQGPPSCLERKEAHPWFNQSFDETVVLFDQVIEIFALSEFARSGKVPSCFHFFEGFWIGCVFINRNDTGSHRVASMKRFCEKTLGCLGIAGGTQQEF